MIALFSSQQIQSGQVSCLDLEYSLWWIHVKSCWSLTQWEIWHLPGEITMFAFLFGRVRSRAALPMARYHWIYCDNSNFYLYLQKKIWKPLKLLPKYVEGRSCLLPNQPRFPTCPISLLYLSWSEETSRSRAETLSPSGSMEILFWGKSVP